MSIVTLEEAKAHLEVVGSGQDAQIQRYVDAAERMAEQFLDRSLDRWCEANSDSDGVSSECEAGVPEDVKQAILLYVGDFYLNREARFVGTIQTDNPAAEFLLHFHRKGLGI